MKTAKSILFCTKLCFNKRKLGNRISKTSSMLRCKEETERPAVASIDMTERIVAGQEVE
jgi:hypothetical protein